MFSGNSFAKNAKMQMSQKLWGGLKQGDIEKLKNFSTAIDNDDYQAALEIAKEMKGINDGKSAFADTVMDIALWNKYSQIDDKKFNTKTVSFNDISRFVNDNQFFPNLTELRKNAEKIAVTSNIPYNFSKQYFKNFPATNIDSKLYLLNSKINAINAPKLADKVTNPTENLQQDITNLIINIWISENFSPEKEAKFLSNYGNSLTEENHVARIKRLLWDKKEEDAKRIFYLVGQDYQKLFTSIITIDKNPKYIDQIILSIPRNLRGNELLAYKVIMWKKAQLANDKGSVKEIANMVLEVPANVGNPEKWWSLKNFYCREMIKAKDYKKAYSLASSHGLSVSSLNFSDAEWLSGWLALRFLNKPKVAYSHFNNLYVNVTYPISISRAAYWLGMASLEMGDRQKSIDWYKIAAKYPTYFYGQLAIHKHRVLDSVGSQNDIILPKDPDILGSDIQSMAQENSLKTGYILALIGDKKSAAKIFEYAVLKTKTDGEIAVIMKVVNELNDKALDVKISKIAAKKNVFFIKDKFQILKEIENEPQAPLVHAIIKQESGFAPSALSSVGAIGFMQLMPATAELVCKKNGIKYDRKKLATDMGYNIVLGSSYIRSLIDEFGGSELLAIASYNAGPNATRRWISEFYDPRKTQNIDEVVDWVELITYAETRNYVQRIMENLIVYKYLMSRLNYDDIK